MQRPVARRRRRHRAVHGRGGGGGGGRVGAVQGGLEVARRARVVQLLQAAVPLLLGATDRPDLQI